MTFTETELLKLKIYNMNISEFEAWLVNATDVTQNGTWQTGYDEGYSDGYSDGENQ